ncbi:nucleolar pre-ribosomal-associated protein 2 [Cladorrhinum sp. PSN259]|nr:nucleolar pre-ribosomal-associated protein 2 [Cladorrhinum sp. PSN259]
MGNGTRAGEAALVKAVRALDQGDVETTPERLERVWDTLSEYDGGNFHAAEEMLLRWLLKNMTGSAANAERVRRYPRAWDIMGAVFARIPLFSLAKSLADRRFVSILQQTLKEISTPQESIQPNGGESDVEMADAPSPENPLNPRKRKRTTSMSFDMDAQKRVVGCLQAGEAVFDALRTLLSRCETKATAAGLPNHRMGAEHIKSLFSTSSTEIMQILVPMLTLCGLAAEKATTGPVKEQSSWLSTFNAIWELHLQGPMDANEVATHLSLLGTHLLGKLTNVPRHIFLTIDPITQEQWSRDLRRFLARNLILPARAAFLNRESKELVQLAVETSSFAAPTAFPVLFDLVSGSSREAVGNTSIKSNETWVQSVFDAILKASKHLDPKINSLEAIRTILDMAVAKGTILTISSLRTVSKEYALRGNEYDWGMLLSIVKLNPDVFLLSDEGKELLDQILDKTQKPELLSERDYENAAQFIVLLAGGYAQAREVPAFIKTWYKYLAPSDPKGGPQPLWAQKELVSSFGAFIQSSLTSDQLAGLIEWLSAQNANAAKILILAAISGGISHEAYVDAANMASFDGVFAEKISKKDSPAVSACRWSVAERTLTRVTVEEAGKIWERIGSDLKKALRKSPLNQEDTFAAFKCCVAMWLANYSGAEHEEEAAKLVCSFIERLEKDNETMEVDSNDAASVISKETYIQWVLSNWTQLPMLLVERMGQFPEAILSVMKPGGTEDTVRLDIALTTSRLLCNNEYSFISKKLTDVLLDVFVSLIDTSKAGRLGATIKVAIQSLLDMPIEVFDRNHREAAMKSLVARLPGESDKAEAVGVEYWRSVLALMIKLMERPTFYEGMSFSHLESIGRCLLAIHKRSSRRSRDVMATDEVTRDRDNFRSLQRLAVLTIRQMASGTLGEREKTYLLNAVSILQNSSQDSADAIVPVVLFRAIVSAVDQQPQALKKLQEIGLDIETLKNTELLQRAVSIVTSGKWRGKGLVSLLLALEALQGLDGAAVQKAVSEAVPSLLEASNTLVNNGVPAGWEVRMFLVNYFPGALGSPFKIKMASATSAPEDDIAELDPSSAAVGRAIIQEYTNTAVRNADEASKLRYLKELLLEDNEGEDSVERLEIVDVLIHHLKGSKRSESTATFDLSKAHSILCRKLLRTTSAPHFLFLAQTIAFILDQSPACMSQWNIELTLSTVSAISAQSSTESLVAASPKIYQSLSNLVEIVIKRHRKRLDGHFHILLTALQSLLRLLLTGPYDGGSKSNNITAPHPVWEKHARHFSRLLTLICEPTVASVSRSSSDGRLESEKDRAKKYVGQYMYLVLMQYIKLQLECVVPHGVREALERGVYSIVDITTRDGLKIMIDGMDQSGRVIFKEFYKQYEKFGKWQGV